MHFLSGMTSPLPPYDVVSTQSCADGFQYAMNSGDYEKVRLNTSKRT